MSMNWTEPMSPQAHELSLFFSQKGLAGSYLASGHNQRLGCKSNLSTEVTVEATPGRKGRAPEARPLCPPTHQQKAVRCTEEGEGAAV